VRRALALFIAVVLVAPATALAATATQVKDVDTSDYPTIRLTVVAPSESTAPPKLTENGGAVAGLNASSLGRSKSIVLAIDRSQSMRGEPLTNAIAAARAFMAAKPPGDRIAVATYATDPVLLTGFSTSTIDADSALGSISIDPVGGTTLYDAVVLSADALASETTPGRVIILVTDGNETRSEASLEETIAAAQDAGVAVYPVAIESRLFKPEPLKQIAAETGGTYYGAASAEALTAVYQSIGEELRRTWQLEYATRARPGELLTLEVSADGSSVSHEVKMPGIPAPTVEAPKRSPLLPDVFYNSEWGSQLLALAVGLIVLLACIFLFASPKGAWLRGRLKPHIASAERDRKRVHDTERLAFASPVFKATEHAFSGFSLWKRVETTLKRADIPLKAAELIYIMIGSGLAAGAAASVFGPPIYVVAAFIAGGALIPYFVVAYLARKRLRAFENQLPDLLVTMAASLKAGHSFRQGLQSVVDEGQEPASKEFKRVLTETRLGRPMDDALGEMGQRMGSKNFEFVLSAVTIQRQVGGSLAGLFDMVADTVRQRHQFQRKIKGLTAMGRASAYVLVGLPFFVFFAISVIDRDYMDPLFETSTGNKLIIATFVMMAIGSAILKKIVSFKG
jgi:tight adherence protein B